jgi:hypothetical protein
MAAKKYGIAVKIQFGAISTVQLPPCRVTPRSRKIPHAGFARIWGLIREKFQIKRAATEIQSVDFSSDKSNTGQLADFYEDQEQNQACQQKSVAHGIRRHPGAPPVARDSQGRTD